MSYGLRRPEPTRTWHGEYRGVSYEIAAWSRNLPPSSYDTADGVIWNAYIYIDLEEVKDPATRKGLWLKAKKSSIGDHKIYDYYENELLRGIEFHHGITWYSKEFSSQDHKLIKVGCDYNHLWDEGQFYNLDMVVADTVRSIESLYKLLPEYAAKAALSPQPQPRTETEAPDVK